MIERTVEQKKERHVGIGLLGSLGSGKSTVAEILSKRWGVIPITEEYSDNPFLKGFYKSPVDFSFKSQEWFLLNKIDQLSKIRTDSTQIIDPSIEMDRLYALTHYRMGWMTNNEWNCYDNLYRVIMYKRTVAKPDFNIVVTADYETLYKRIEDRAKNENRKFENWMLTNYPEYLKNLSETVSEWSSDNIGCSMIINTGYYDFSKSEHKEEIYRIESHVALMIAENGGILIPPKYGQVGNHIIDKYPNGSEGKF